MITLTCAHAAPSLSNEVSSRSREGRRLCLPEQADSNWIGSPLLADRDACPPGATIKSLHIQAKDHVIDCAAEGNASLADRSLRQRLL